MARDRYTRGTGRTKTQHVRIEGPLDHCDLALLRECLQAETADVFLAELDALETQTIQIMKDAGIWTAEGFPADPGDDSPASFAARAYLDIRALRDVIRRLEDLLPNVDGIITNDPVSLAKVACRLGATIKTAELKPKLDGALEKARAAPRSKNAELAERNEKIRTLADQYRERHANLSEAQISDRVALKFRLSDRTVRRIIKKD